VRRSHGTNDEADEAELSSEHHKISNVNAKTVLAVKYKATHMEILDPISFQILMHKHAYHHTIPNYLSLFLIFSLSHSLSLCLISERERDKNDGACYEIRDLY